MLGATETLHADQTMHPATLPTLFVIGTNHRTAPLEYREKVTLRGEAEPLLAAELSRLSGLREFAILNTCNRMEIYGVGVTSAVQSRVLRAFCERQHLEADVFASHGFVLEGHGAVGHLMEVASGLDSQILGETEILGQVKKAYAAAHTAGTAGPVLNRLFQKAFQSAKCARSGTAITAGQLSVASLAVDLGLSVFGRLSEARVLLLGAGAMGEKSGRAFLSRGAGSITVASRTAAHAADLASRLGAATVAYAEREERLAAWDIVVCSTSAPGTVLSAEAVRRAVRARGSRPLLLIDMAMPRDVEAAVADISGVFLYNLDDLAAIAERNRLARQEEAARARAILAPRADALWLQLSRSLQGLGASAGTDLPHAHGSAQMAFA